MNLEKISNSKTLLISGLILLILIVVSLMIGNYEMNSFKVIKSLIMKIFNNKTFNTEELIVLNIRLPRTISAFLIGASLSLSGILYQYVFRNKLASPDLLGVSTGASVGAAIFIVIGLNALFIQLGAFILGIFTVFITYLVSLIFKNQQSNSLVLSGVLVSGLMTSILGLIKYLANSENELPTIIFWTMGDISNISWQKLSYVIIPLLICIIFSVLIAYKVNVFALDDDVSHTIGVNIVFLKIIIILIATIMTACAVSVAGTIGWIGLAVPQFVRLIIGDNTKNTFKLAILSGAIFLLITDIIGRIISNAELPLSILTGISGLILFILSIYFSSKKEGI